MSVDLVGAADPGLPAFVWLVPVVGIAAPALFGLVVLLIVRARHPSLTVAEVRSRVVDGTWNARLTDSAAPHNPFGGYGTLRLRDGLLSFTPEGQVQSAWSFAAREFAAGRNTRFLASRVWLGHHALGYLNAQVSVEHLNRFSRNDFKSGREVVYADAFLAELAAAGASVQPW